MSNPESLKEKNILIKTRNTYMFLSVISLATFVSTFLLSTSGLAFGNKVIGFIGLVVVYGLIVAAFYYRSSGSRDEILKRSGDDTEYVFDNETEEKLSVLDHANAFFSASLKPEDMFRLISSRVNEVVQFQTCVLFMLDSEKKLNVQYAAGVNAGSFTKVSIGCDEGLAGKALFSESIERDPNLRLEGRAIPKISLDGLNSAVAIPLQTDAEFFGIIVLYSDREEAFDEEILVLLEAIKERISPLLSSSFTFEKSLSNSMTDSLTELPNERAFYLVFENQLAESQRFQSQRPLTILAFDIKGFTDFNRKYGHASGDRILKFTSTVISSQLRKMDFLSRFKNDEFWAVIPTASGALAGTIVQRIETSLIEKPFKLADGESYLVKLNIGSASFGDDGETIKQLIQIAGLRKRQAKSDDQGSVIMFPKKRAN